jgi:3D (Asp-Asp-Asp) domain-containing protein
VDGLIGRFFMPKRPLLPHFYQARNMIKKLTFSAVLLTMLVLTSNAANASGWGLDSNSDNAHPLINSASDWSVSKLAKFDLTQKNDAPEETPEPTPVPSPVKTKAVKINPIATYVVMASAYSSTPDQTDSTPFITAWGTQVRDGIIAANFLPFGTKIKMPELYGDKIFVVEDRMNRRYTYKIDVWFPERSQAMEFGNKKVTIVVVAKI